MTDERFDSSATTTCGYCGVGCRLETHTRAGRVVSISPATDGPANRGHTCLKGRFAHQFSRSRERLSTPLIREDGALRSATWEEALARIARELGRIKTDHGPDAIAGLASSRATNEDCWAMQRMMRAAIGTNNIDNCSRVCHAPTSFALRKSLGFSGATGSFDDLEAVAAFARGRGLWLHVDGAHGAAALLSPKYRHLVRGLDRADSFIWDAHKNMLMPALATAVLFREGGRSYEAFSTKASYLFERSAREEWYNYAHRTMECTKTMMGLRLFISLAAYGTDFFGGYVTAVYDLARDFAALIRDSGDFEAAVEPESNIVCFRYLKKGEADLDGLQRRIRRTLLERGNFYVVQAEFRGRAWLRCTLVNPRTTLADLEALLAEIRAVA